MFPDPVFAASQFHSRKKQEIRAIPVDRRLLIGKFLGYKTPNSGNFWVQYLENRNHLIELFARLGCTFANISHGLGCMFANILKHLPQIHALQKISGFAKQKSPLLSPLKTALRYLVGLDAVNSEQQGLPTGWNSMVSARVPSGSNRLYCHLASRPILGPLFFWGNRSPK